MLPKPKSILRNHLRQFWAAYLVLIVSLVPALVVWSRLKETVKDKESSYFRVLVRDTHREMDLNVRHHFAALTTMRGFFQASEKVEPEEWNRYLANMELGLRYPAYNAVGFARRIPLEEKTAFEKEQHQHGATAYHLTNAVGNVDYFPLTLLSPEQLFPLKEQAFNLAALPEVLAAMEMTIASGKPEASKPVTLTLWPDNRQKSYILLVLPIYSRTNLAGLSKVEGFLVGFMELDRMFSVLLENARRDFLNITVTEEQTQLPPKLIYSSSPYNGPRQHTSIVDANFHETRTFVFASQAWTLDITARESFFDSTESYLPQISIVGGLLISAALFGITWGQVRARSLAEKLSGNLAASEERFRLVNKATNDVVYDWDVPKDRITWNEAMSLSFNYAPEKIQPTLQWWEERVHPLDRVRVVRGLESALKKGGEFWADEYRFLRGDGNYSTVIDRGYILRDEKGEVIRMIGSMMDITDRKKAEEARFKSDQKLKLHFEQTPLAVIEWNLSFQVVDWNPGAEKTFGYSAQEAIGRHASELIVPESARRLVNEIWQSLLLANRHGQRSTNQNCTKDGRTIVCDWYNTPVIDRDGKVISVITLAMDVTEQRHVADALAEEKELLSVTMRSIGEAVIATDTAENIVLINRVAEHLLGCHQNDVIGHPLTRWLKLQHLKTGMIVESPVTRVLRANGQFALHSQQAMLVGVPVERRISYSCNPIHGGDSHLLGSVLVFRDVSDEARTAEELLKASKLESLGILAGGIAHDFNNILTVIIGNISIAKMQTPASSAASTRLDEAEKASLKARDLTLQLLTFAKGGAPIKQTASITELLRDTAAFVLHGSNAQCIFDLEPNLWPVEVDEGQISQVIDNLVINAVQAMPKGGRILVSSRNVTLEANSGLQLPAGKYVQACVQDEGTGIPSEILPKIFDPYFTTKTSGSGLGLATSYSIVRNHNGLMTVQSNVGEGTIFKVYLPASDKPLKTDSSDTTHFIRRQGRILVMDDDERIRELLKSMIEALGYQVEISANGNEAVNSYRNAMSAGKRFNAIIMDLTVPGGMGGKEALNLIKDLDPKVRAIVSSGYSNDPIMANHRENGFIGVLSKPYKIQDLAKTLESTIQQEI